MINLQSVLTSASPITAITQGRITNGLMPQDYARPFSVWEVVIELGVASLSCKPDNDDVRASVNCYSRDAKEARLLGEAVRDAVEDAYTTEVNLIQLPFEKDTKLFHWVVDFKAIVDR